VAIWVALDGLGCREDVLRGRCAKLAPFLWNIFLLLDG
jgi:hypothetical protein